MSQKNHQAGSKYEHKRRLEEIAYLIDEMSKKELAEYADVSVRTIERDIKYIEAHREEFFF